jgi:uncharacterized protein YprB with RNaseH-like and TPR domain
MKTFFINKIFNKDKSVTIREFKTLFPDLFNKTVEMNSDLGFCTILDTETTGLDHKQDPNTLIWLVKCVGNSI